MTTKLHHNTHQVIMLQYSSSLLVVIVFREGYSVAAPGRTRPALCVRLLVCSGPRNHFPWRIRSSRTGHHTPPCRPRRPHPHPRLHDSSNAPPPLSRHEPSSSHH